MADDATATDAPAEADAGDATEEGSEAAATVEVPMAYGVPVTTSIDQSVLHPSADELLATAQALYDDGFVALTDVTCVDYLTFPTRGGLAEGIAAERFEVVVSVLNMDRRERMRLRVQVPEADPVVPSLFDVWPGSEAREREVFDMFGVSFTDHPDMTRVLMPEDWDGHPLRKDYAIGRIPVQFKEPSANR